MIRTYIRLYAKERRILAFGMLMTFFSSFGQTFYISLFVPDWEREFAMGSGMFGSLYSLATLCSAALLPLVGRLVDTCDLRRLALGVAMMIAIGCAGLSVVLAPWHLLVLLFVLRLSGQGMCGHIANTTMARHFEEDRGKALSMSALGFPIGEALFPMFAVALIAAVGWRQTCLLDAGIVIIVLMPLISWLLAPDTLRQPPGRHATPLDPAEKEWTRAHVLQDWRFYALLPNYLSIPFAVTGLIIHQVRLAEFKGWSMATLAYAFIGFAMLRIICSLAIGPNIDRWGARRLFPFVSLPMAVGIALLTIFESAWVAVAYLALTGASMGIAGAVGTALWAEMYGVRHLGAIKSLSSSLAVFGTALSPALFGWLLDADLSFPWLLWGTSVGSILAAAISMTVCFRQSES